MTNGKTRVISGSIRVTTDGFDDVARLGLQGAASVLGRGIISAGVPVFSPLERRLIIGPIDHFLLTNPSRARSRRRVAALTRSLPTAVVSIYYFNYRRETTIRRREPVAACTHYRSCAPAKSGLSVYVRISCRNYSLPILPLVCVCVCVSVRNSLRLFLGDGRRNFSSTTPKNNRKRSHAAAQTIVCLPRSVSSAIPLEPALRAVNCFHCCTHLTSHLRRSAASRQPKRSGGARACAVMHRYASIWDNLACHHCVRFLNGGRTKRFASHTNPLLKLPTGNGPCCRRRSFCASADSWRYEI